MLALLAVVIAALAIQKTGQEASVASVQAAEHPGPTLPPPRPTVTLVGDEITADVASRASGTAWTQRLMVMLPASVTTLAARNAAFDPVSGRGVSYRSLAEDIPTDSDVVLFFAGVHDDRTGSALDRMAAATDAVAEAHRRAPSAKIILVGPIATATRSPTSLLPVRQTLSQAAKVTDVVWVDPIAAKWFDAQDVALLEDGITLTGAGERTLRDRFDALIGEYLAARA